MNSKRIAIVGGGPAGLIAAEILSAQNFEVTLYERKSTVGRKFLMAGRGGLNLTHSEDLSSFIQRYGSQSDILNSIIRDFPPQALRDWCEGLGEKTFIGTSGRVFPESFKASPLLKAWIGRLKEQGVTFLHNYDWQGWDKDSLVFQTPDGVIKVKPDATLLALGGASWPRLGSDGAWAPLLKQQGVDIKPLEPANCGFLVEWSTLFKDKFAGQPLKPVAVSLKHEKAQGEMMISEKGIEGGVIYALSSKLREEINKNGKADITLDLKPDLSLAATEERLRIPRGSKSLSPHLAKVLKLSPTAVGLLMENPERGKFASYPSSKLAQLIKSCPLTLQAPYSIERAISTAGGVTFTSIDESFMLVKKPSVFVAGEMLDWEAPTGGYLLQACFATGVKAAQGIASFLK